MISFDVIGSTFFVAQGTSILIKSESSAESIKFPFVIDKVRVTPEGSIYLLSGEFLYRKLGSEVKLIYENVADFNVDSDKLIVLFRNGTVKDELDGKNYGVATDASFVCRNENTIFFGTMREVFSLNKLTLEIRKLFEVEGKVIQIECIDSKVVVLSSKFLYFFKIDTGTYEKQKVPDGLAGIRCRDKVYFFFHDGKIEEYRKPEKSVVEATLLLEDVVENVPYKLVKEGPIFKNSVKVWIEENQTWTELDERAYSVDYDHSIIRFHRSLKKTKVVFLKPGFKILNIYTRAPFKENESLSINGYYGVSVMLGQTESGIYQPFSLTVKGKIGKVNLWGTFENPEAGPTPLTSLYRKYFVLEAGGFLLSFGDVIADAEEKGKLLTGIKLGYRSKKVSASAFGGFGKETSKRILIKLTSHTIELNPHTPVPGSITLYVNGRRLQEGKDFLYMEENNQIVLSPSIELEPPPVLYITFVERNEESDLISSGLNTNFRIPFGTIKGKVSYTWERNSTELNMKKPDDYHLEFRRQNILLSMDTQTIKGSFRSKILNLETSYLDRLGNNESGNFYALASLHPSLNGFTMLSRGEINLSPDKAVGRLSTLLGYRLFLLGGGIDLAKGEPPHNAWLETRIHLKRSTFKVDSQNRWYIHKNETETRLHINLRTRFLSVSAYNFLKTPQMVISSSGMTTGKINSAWFLRRDENGNIWVRTALSLPPYATLSYIRSYVGSESPLLSLKGKLQIPLLKIPPGYTLYFDYTHMFTETHEQSTLRRESILKIAGVPWSASIGAGSNRTSIYPLIGAGYLSGPFRISYSYSGYPDWIHRFEVSSLFNVWGYLTIEGSLELSRNSARSSFGLRFRKDQFCISGRGIYQKGVEECSSFHFSVRMFL